MRNLTDKAVLVTGAGAGIGEAIARRFVAEGAKVMLADIDEDSVAKAAGALGMPYVKLDISDASAFESAIAATVEKLGSFDILVVGNLGDDGLPFFLVKVRDNHVRPARPRAHGGSRAYARCTAGDDDGFANKARRLVFRRSHREFLFDVVNGFNRTSRPTGFLHHASSCHSLR